jgi:hypothetical protein
MYGRFNKLTQVDKKHIFSKLNRWLVNCFQSEIKFLIGQSNFG